MVGDEGARLGGGNKSVEVHLADGRLARLMIGITQKLNEVEPLVKESMALDKQFPIVKRGQCNGFKTYIREKTKTCQDTKAKLKILRAALEISTSGSSLRKEMEKLESYEKVMEVLQGMQKQTNLGKGSDLLELEQVFVSCQELEVKMSAVTFAYKLEKKGNHLCSFQKYDDMAVALMSTKTEEVPRAMFWRSCVSYMSCSERCS